MFAVDEYVTRERVVPAAPSFVALGTHNAEKEGISPIRWIHEATDVKSSPVAENDAVPIFVITPALGVRAPVEPVTPVAESKVAADDTGAVVAP